MPALVLIGTPVAAAVVIAAAVAVLLIGLRVIWVATGPEQRLIRERRRHAERTACAMRRMTEIRTQTAERMDRTEEGRPR